VLRFAIVAVYFGLPTDTGKKPEAAENVGVDPFQTCDGLLALPL